MDQRQILEFEFLPGMIGLVVVFDKDHLWRIYFFHRSGKILAKD